MKTKSLLLLRLVVALGIWAVPLGSETAVFPPKSPVRAPRGDLRAQARAGGAYGQLPMSFEANKGQTDPRVRFLSRGRGYTLFLTAGEAVLTLRKATHQDTRAQNRALARRADLISKSAAFGGRSSITGFENNSAFHRYNRSVVPEFQAPAVLRMAVVGANHKVKVIGLDELTGKSNYFIGNDPEKWTTNVATYARVRYQDVYPGVDLVYYGRQRKVEYDFVVAPGSDPGVIGWELQGTHGPLPMRLNERGDLLVRVNGGDVCFYKPVAYQTAGDSKHYIEAHYRLHQSGGSRGAKVGFEVGAYDTSRTLVIDPVLSYSTYLGGGDLDIGQAIAVDASGSAYVTGYTASLDFPTANPFQATKVGGYNAFVSKLNAAGTALVYSTYLGGSGYDVATGIAVDSSGSAYVTGNSSSTNFPLLNPIQTTNRGLKDAFVTKFNAAGSALVYSTYLGGSGDDYGVAIAVNGSGTPCVTGYTTSFNFPTAFPRQASKAGGEDVFVAKFSAAGSALLYSTYLGGSNHDDGRSVALDSAGNAYVTGNTMSLNFPTAGPLQAANAGLNDAFVSKLNSAGQILVYSTYLGGGDDDIGYSIATDSSGKAYVTGSTFSLDFPTGNALQPANGGFIDAFVAQLDAAGSAFVYSTYLGGSDEDDGLGIAVDGLGSAHVTGLTASSNFPTADAIQPAYSGGFGDAFVTKLNPAGSAMVYSTYFGGSSFEQGYAVVMDGSANAYLTGATGSSDFPTAPTAGPLQGTNAGVYDAFVAKLSSGAFPTVELSTISLTFGEQVVGTTSAPESVVVTNTGNAALEISSLTASGDFQQSNNCGTMLAAGANCNIDVVFVPTAPGARTGVLTLAGNTEQSPYEVSLSGTGTDHVAPTLTIAANPPLLWPPYGHMVTVTVMGTISDSDSGVNADSVTYAVTDEYGSIQPQGSVSVALGPSGAYTFTLRLQAYREGSDYDGRRYRITLTARDNAGNVASLSAIVIVPHDFGPSVELQKLPRGGNGSTFSGGPYRPNGANGGRTFSSGSIRRRTRR